MNITWNADNDPLSILPGIMIIDVAGTQILWSLICYLFIFICHICWYHHLDLYRFMIIHIYSLCFIIYHICCLYLFNIFDLIYIYISLFNSGWTRLLPRVANLGALAGPGRTMPSLWSMRSWSWLLWSFRLCGVCGAELAIGIFCDPELRIWLLWSSYSLGNHSLSISYWERISWEIPSGYD